MVQYLLQALQPKRYPALSAVFTVNIFRGKTGDEVFAPVVTKVFPQFDIKGCLNAAVSLAMGTPMEAPIIFITVARHHDDSMSA